MLDNAAIDARGVLITACMRRHPPCRWTRSTVYCAFNRPLRFPHDCQLEHLSAETAPYRPTTSAQPAALPTTHPSALSWSCSPSVRSPWHHSHTASKLFISRLSLMHLHNSYYKRSWNHQPSYLQNHFSGMLRRCMLVVVFHWKMSFFLPLLPALRCVHWFHSDDTGDAVCWAALVHTHTHTHTHTTKALLSAGVKRVTRWRYEARPLDGALL